jgi:hypothetical protein
MDLCDSTVIGSSADAWPKSTPPSPAEIIPTLAAYRAHLAVRLRENAESWRRSDLDRGRGREDALLQAVAYVEDDGILEELLKGEK